MNQNNEVSTLHYEADKNTKMHTILHWIRLLSKSKTGMIGFVIFVLVLLIAIFAPLIAPYDPNLKVPENILKPPFWMSDGSMENIFGTDYLGRDIFSRIIYGSRISIFIGVTSVIIAGFLGGTLGLIAGYYGGWLDNIVMRLVDSFLAIPSILIVLVIIGVFGPNVLTVVFVLGIAAWANYARLIRGEVLSIKEKDFVRAAISIGVKDHIIIARHILPNTISTFIVISTLTVASAIILEASLSFLGLGVQSPFVSWGLLLSEGRDYLATSWWLATFPGIAITITVLGIVFLGDWLRDVLDPKL